MSALFQQLTLFLTVKVNVLMPQIKGLWKDYLDFPLHSNLKFFIDYT